MIKYTKRTGKTGKTLFLIKLILFQSNKFNWSNQNKILCQSTKLNVENNKI